MAYLRSAILGGVDGVITSFAVVAGASVMTKATSTVVVVGSSSILADGVSMGISEFLSTASETARKTTTPPPATTTTTQPPSATTMGLVCFLSFVVCGAVPLMVFVLGNESLLATAMFSAAQLMVLGALRVVVTKELLWIGVSQTSLLGIVAGGVAYGVAHGVAVFTD